MPSRRKTAKKSAHTSDSENYKRCKKVMKSVAEEYVCPITTDLPVDPVTAEDGRIYERSAIEQHIRTRRNDLMSPATNKPMGPKLLAAVQVRNTIKMLVESGTINGGIAARWKERIKMSKRVEKSRKKAEKGDTDAMCDLGEWYYHGQNGLEEDYKRAYEWYKRASDLHSAEGMAHEGYSLVTGQGVKENIAYGVNLIGIAAQAGSDMGAYYMGVWHKDGEYRLPVDKAKAKYWFGKVVEGSCRFEHLCEEAFKDAKRCLDELEAESE